MRPRYRDRRDAKPTLTRLTNLGGILLGPTAFGRIPGFTEHIFPSQSIPYLSLVANIGLSLFLFLVGLEIDAGVITRNAKMSLTVALAGIIVRKSIVLKAQKHRDRDVYLYSDDCIRECVAFGLGACLSLPLYHHFVDQTVQFAHFMLFAGVAFSITAFPVLCRILTELKLLDTTVGIVVLSAGVGNDIVGWTLLALSVALVNASSGLTALYILLACVGWTLFLLLLVKRVVLWVAIQTGSINNGPSKSFMTFVMLLMFGSAFFTDVIGVHAIFGLSQYPRSVASSLNLLHRCFRYWAHRPKRRKPRHHHNRETRGCGCDHLFASCAFFQLAVR